MKEKTVDGIRFQAAPFSAIEALRLKSFLLKKFGPSIGQVLGLLKDGLPTGGNIGDVNIDGSALSGAIEKLMEQLGEDEYVALIKRLFRNVTAHITRDGQPLQFSFVDHAFETSMNAVFAGRLFSVYPVMLLVLEANFPDFFGRMAQGIGSKIRETFTSGAETPNSPSEPEL